MAGLTFSEYLHLIRDVHLRNLMSVIVSNQIACEGVQFPTYHLKDPFLSSVIPVVTPTRCHRANGGNPIVGECRLTCFLNYLN